MHAPSFIRTVTAGTGISPVHVHLGTRGLPSFLGLPPVGNWVKGPSPCPEGFFILFWIKYIWRVMRCQ